MHKISKAALLAALCFMPTMAFAEDNDDAIVVTATRSETAIEDLPSQVTVIDTQRARERGAISLDAALADVPGVQSVRSGPIGQQASIFSGGFESNHTLVLYDGVRIDDPASPEGLFDAGQDTLGDAVRIEYVQGPMSALYGSQALGGVVNILPRRGGEGAFNPGLDFSSGSFGTVLANVSADGALGSFRYAVNAESYASDGYDITPERVATYTGEKDGAEMTTLTGVFDYAVTQNFSLDLLLRHREARADYDPASFPPPFFDETLTDDPDAEISQNDSDLQRLGATWDITEALNLRATAGVVNTDRAIADGGFVTDEFHGRRRFQDITGTFTGEAVNVVAGAVWDDEDIDAVQFGSPIDASAEHWGAFAATQASFGPVDLTGAVRHDDFDSFGGHNTWRAGVVYHVIDSARIYASYGTSYRAPSLYERFVFFGNPDLKPEEAESWEIGADARFTVFGRANGLELGALYRSSDIDNLIAFDSSFTYANVNRAEIDFAEGRVALRPLSWLTAKVTYANTDARDATTDEQLRRRPRHAWSAALEAENGPFSGQILWRQVGARSDIVYGDDGAFDGVGRAASYEVLSLSAAWQVSEAVRLYATADNALDEEYETANGFAAPPANVLFGIRIRPALN